ncbi:MAG: Fe-S-containing hydro-lyase [Clostridiales bacterium]|nr:Fe-S-containing hydro-lyase [Clostridiales bacterium]
MSAAPIRIQAPLSREVVDGLKSGDVVSITGTIYMARDAAHKKLIALLDEGSPLPFDVNGQIIYYAGPCPERPGEVIGSAGPTTSGRMDAYAPALIRLGLSGMIGKGARNKAVIDAMVEKGAVYFGATGGAAVTIASSVKASEVIAFPELGPEALRKLFVEDFRAIVVIDSKGNDLYKTGREKYRVII